MLKLFLRKKIKYVHTAVLFGEQESNRMVLRVPERICCICHYQPGTTS